MSSSISASEAGAWRRLLARYAAATLALGLAVSAVILALDPYDTGRFALVPGGAVPDFGQRLAFASIARRPGIDTAIIGNSSIELIDPARLSALSGRHAVSLAVPGTGPLEQLAIADWFRNHHRLLRISLVFGLDQGWCTTADPIPLQNPFPFWLYGRSRLDYALNMLTYKSIEAAWRKVKLLAGRERAARADGYHDYDTGHAYHAPDFAALEAPQAPPASASPADFTAPPKLRAFLGQLDPAATVLLVFVPRHASDLPAPGTLAAERQDACKDVYRAIAAARPNTTLVDFLVPSAMAKDDANFWDPVHYRGPVARAIEDRLAAALGS